MATIARIALSDKMWQVLLTKSSIF